MKKILLHLGMHKTGTTSIQASMNGYDDGQVRYARLGAANHSVALSTLFMDDPCSFSTWKQAGKSREFVEARADDFRRALDHDLGLPHPLVVLSAEDLNRFTPDEMRRLYAHLAKSGRRIEVLVYLRDPLGFSRSLFQQYVLSTKSDPTLQPPEYHRKFGDLKDIFGADAITYRAFDRAQFPGGSVVRDFAKQCGIEADKLREKRANEGRPDGFVKLRFAFNQAMPVLFGTEALVHASRRLNSLLVKAVDDVPFSVSDACLQVDQALLDDVDWLARESGIDFRDTLPDPSIPFDPKRLARELADIDAASIAALDGLLQSRAIATGPQHSPAQKVALLYYSVLGEASHRPGQNARHLGAWLLGALRAAGRRR